MSTVAAPPLDVRITHIGGPTALLEIGPWRLLTDPTFDAPGRRYVFAPLISSTKLAGPVVQPDAVLPIDAVLLSHDHHDDNLDDAGRALLPQCGRTITTPAGAKRLGAGTTGLAPWEQTTLEAAGRPAITITATPARHGPPGSRPLVGQVTGFLLQWDGQRDGALWISGDTVWFAGVQQVGERFDVGTAILHFGGVRFPVSGPMRYTMNAAEGVRVARELGPRTIVPIHFEGWKHFREGRDVIEREFAQAGLTDRLQWLVPGEAAPLSGC